MTFGERLKQIGVDKYGRMDKFAEELGIAPPALSRYLADKVEPKASFLIKLQELGCDVMWLLTGVERSLGTLGTGGTLEEGRKGQEGLKGFEYPVVSIIGAGEVIPFDNEIEEHIVFPYKHKNCVALRVQGDSMIPFIEDGDIVLVDLVKRPNQGDIVAVRTKAGEQFIKKLMVVERNKKTFHLFSLNPAYPLRAFNFDEVETVKKVVMVLKDTDYGNGEEQR